MNITEFSVGLGTHRSLNKEYDLNSLDFQIRFLASIKPLDEFILGGASFKYLTFDGTRAIAPLSGQVGGSEGEFTLLGGIKLSLFKDALIMIILGYGTVMGNMGVALRNSSFCPDIASILANPDIIASALQCQLAESSGFYRGNPITLDLSLVYQNFHLGIYGRFLDVHKDRRQTLPDELISGGIKTGFLF